MANLLKHCLSIYNYLVSVLYHLYELIIFQDICPVRELENFRKQLNDAKRKMRNDSVALEARLAEALAQEASARAHAQQEISDLKSQVNLLAGEFQLKISRFLIFYLYYMLYVAFKYRLII